jgi:hypothetical protein
VFPPNLNFYFGILRWFTPQFQGFWLLWYVYFYLIVHHLQDIGGMKISKGPKHVNFWQLLFLQFKQTTNVPNSSKTCKFKMWIQDVHLFMHNYELKSSRTMSRTKTINVECFNLLNNQTSGVILLGNRKKSKPITCNKFLRFTPPVD